MLYLRSFLVTQNQLTKAVNRAHSLFRWMERRRVQRRRNRRQSAIHATDDDHPRNPQNRRTSPIYTTPQPTTRVVTLPRWETHSVHGGAKGLTDRHVALAERIWREATANTDAPRGARTPETDSFLNLSSHSLCPVTYMLGFVSWDHMLDDTCAGNVRLGLETNEVLSGAARLAVNAYHSPMTATNRTMREQRERLFQEKRTTIGGDADAEGRPAGSNDDRHDTNRAA